MSEHPVWLSVLRYSSAVAVLGFFSALALPSLADGLDEAGKLISASIQEHFENEPVFTTVKLAVLGLAAVGLVGLYRFLSSRSS